MNTIKNEFKIEKLDFSSVKELSVQDLAIEEIFEIAYRKSHTQGEIKHLLKNSPIEFLQTKIESMVEEELVSIEDIPPIFLEEYNIAFLYVKQDISNMVMLPQHYADNEEFIHDIASKNGLILNYASERVKNIESIVDSALRNNKKSFKYFPEQYKTKENCLIALTGSYPDYSYNWQYIPSPLNKDEGFIKEVGLFCPKIYQYLESSIKNKYEITEYFLKKDSSNLQYASEEHKNNIVLVNPIVEKQPSFLRFAGNLLKNDPNFIFPIIKKSPYEIQVCGEEIKENIEIAKYICNIKTAEPAIGFFNEEIKSNITIAMMSVLKNPESMNYISKKLSSDIDFVSSYIEQENFKPEALHYISNELKNNASIMMKAYDRDTDCIEYIGSNLKYNSEFVDYISPKYAKGKNIHKSIYIKNLKKLKLTSGDEAIVLNFFKILLFNITTEEIKMNFILHIEDFKFAETLRSKNDLGAYLKSATLKLDLEKTLIKQETKEKKLKV